MFVGESHPLNNFLKVSLTEIAQKCRFELIIYSGVSETERKTIMITHLNKTAIFFTIAITILSGVTTLSAATNISTSNQLFAEYTYHATKYIVAAHLKNKLGFVNIVNEGNSQSVWINHFYNHRVAVSTLYKNPPDTEFPPYSPDSVIHLGPLKNRDKGQLISLKEVLKVFDELYIKRNEKPEEFYLVKSHVDVKKSGKTIRKKYEVILHFNTKYGQWSIRKIKLSN